MVRAVASILVSSMALAACGTGGGGTPATSQPSPQPSPSTAQGPIGFLDNSGSKMRTTGCTAKLVFIWRADDPSGVPPRAVAVIKVKGPKIAGTYKRPVRDGKVTLRFSVRMNRQRASWVGTLISVGGRPAQPSIPITHPFLNTDCGPGPRPGPESLPPGTPVPGAPCDPNQPAPPGFKCEPKGN